MEMVSTRKDPSKTLPLFLDLDKMGSPKDNVRITPLDDAGSSKSLSNEMPGANLLNQDIYRKSMFYYRANEVNTKLNNDDDIMIQSQENKRRSTIMARDIDEFQMSRLHRQLRPTVSAQGLNSLAKITPVLRKLKSLRNKLGDEARYEKAARHFKDAKYLRAVRHDIDTTDSKFIKTVYFIQTNPIWGTVLYALSWLYMLISFFEAPNAKSVDFIENNHTQIKILCAIEAVVLGFYAIELFMDTCHRFHDTKSFKEKFLFNKKYILKITLDFIFFLDFGLYYSSHSGCLRFSRCFRPVCLILYSYHIRKTFYGIARSMREMVNVILLLLGIACLFALLGMVIIGDLGGEVEYDKYISNFTQFGTAMNGFFVLFSLDNYPEIMLPAIKLSKFYLLFFIPFVAINILLLIPIPIAVIFDAFRMQKHRSSLVVEERLKEREALVACFLTLDVNENKTLGKEEIICLCKALYRDRLNVSKIHEIYELAEKDRNERIVLPTFFELVEILDTSQHILLERRFYFKAWEQFRRRLNKCLKFDEVIKNSCFELVIDVLILFNTVILAIWICGKCSDTQLHIFNLIDTILTFIYMCEVIIKIFGQGFTKYFSSFWNIMDFIFSGISMLTYSIVEHRQIFTSISKDDLVFRLSRGPRVLKILRVLKNFRIFNCFSKFADLNRMMRLLENIFLCFPIGIIEMEKEFVKHLIMTIYFFAIIGMEIFTEDDIIEEESPYIEQRYADFNSFGGSCLQLFQIITETTWALILFDYAWRCHNLFKASLYFNSFRVIANMIILSLLTGLIWEIFTYMEKYREEEVRVDQEFDRYMQVKSIKDSRLPQTDTSPHFDGTYLDSQFSEDVSMPRASVLRKATKSKTGIDAKSSELYNIDKDESPETARNHLLSEEDQLVLTDRSPINTQTDQLTKEHYSNTLASLDNLPLRTLKSLSSKNRLISINENLASKEDDNIKKKDSLQRMNTLETYDKFSQNELNQEERNTDDNSSKPRTKPQLKTQCTFNLETEEAQNDATSNNQQQDLSSSDEKEEIIEKIPFDADYSMSRTAEEAPKSIDYRDITLDVPPVKSINDSELKDEDLTTKKPGLTREFSFKKQKLVNKNSPRHSISLPSKRESDVSELKASMKLKIFPKLSSLGKNDLSIDGKMIQRDRSFGSISSPANDVTRQQLSPLGRKKSIKDFIESFILGSNKAPSHNDSVNMISEKNLSPLADNKLTKHNFRDKGNENINSMDVSKSSLTQQDRTRIMKRLNTPAPSEKKSSPTTPRRTRNSLQLSANILQDLQSADLSISNSSENSGRDSAHSGIFEEREFYTRKISVCIHIPKFSNQLDYVFDPTQKIKFTHDILILRLEGLEEEDAECFTPNSEEKSIDNYGATTQTQELEKRKMRLRTYLKGNNILRKALLKGTNKDAVQQYENEYFKKVYGKWFEYLHNPKVERVLDIFKTENNILIRMMRLLRQQDTPNRDFIELIYMIESSININLLQRGSMGKFLFKDSKDKWFVLYKEKQKFQIQYLEAGFWTYFADVFKDTTKLYEGRDILFPGAKAKYEDVVRTFHKSLKQISRKIPHNNFAEFSRNDFIWNMYAVPMETSSPKSLRANVLKATKADLKTNIKSVDKCLVTNGLFLSMNFIMKAKKSEREKNPRKLLHSSYSLKKQSLKRKSSVDFEVMKDGNERERRNGVSFGKAGRGKSLNDEEDGQNTEGRFFDDDDEQQGDKKQPKISGTDEFLPLQEYVDFLMDIRDTLNIHKDHLLTRLSHFYLGLNPDK